MIKKIDCYTEQPVSGKPVEIDEIDYGLLNELA